MTETYHTPFIIRWGLLHDYWRTGGFAFLIACANAYISVAAGFGDVFTILFGSFLSIWMWAWVFIWFGGLLIARGTVNHLHSVFGVFDSETLKPPNLKPYSRFTFRKDDSCGVIRDLFSREDFGENYITDIKKQLFKPTEYKAGLIIAAIWIIIGFYSYSQLDPGMGFEGVFLVPFLILCATTFTISSLCMASLGQMLFILAWRIVNLGKIKKSLAINSYISVITPNLQDSSDQNDTSLDYHGFYSAISHIGRGLGNLSLGLVFIVAFISTYWIILVELSLIGVMGKLIVYIIAILFFTVTMIFFAIPQYQLHIFLSEHKRNILRILFYTQTETGLTFISGVQSGNIEDIEMKKDIYEGFESLTRSIKNASTWCVNVLSLLQITAALLLPIMTAMLTDYLRYIILGE
jgi:hypothetical protein